MLFSSEKSVLLTVLLRTLYFFVCTMHSLLFSTKWIHCWMKTKTIVPSMFGVHVNFKIRVLQWSAAQLCGKMLRGGGGGGEGGGKR